MFNEESKSVLSDMRMVKKRKKEAVIEHFFFYKPTIIKQLKNQKIKIIIWEVTFKIHLAPKTS